MGTGVRVDPYGNFNFLVELDGLAVGAFSEVTGLNATTDVMEYREGGDNLTPRKLPAMTKFDNIVLKRGLTDDDTLYKWHREVVEGTIKRKSGSIVVLDRAGAEKVRWNFKDAWPTKWNPPDLNATGNQVAVEELELAHEGLVRA
jgi:phage tail-like protein